ncbi:MAG: hypothetical protein IKR95_00325 [Oscillospiraceae bacterium]|nr:hypothetical protein [Oscillospiraceae bacterium]
MTIEALFPEFCQWLGDSANVRYLCQCMPDAQLIRTYSNDRPNFPEGTTDILYLGSMTERQQIVAAERLMPYRARLLERIDAGMVILATGNSIELFGEYIRDGGERIPMLGLFQFHAERDMDNRHNSMFLGSFEDMAIVGYKSQFSYLKGSFPGDFIRVKGGCGNYMGDKNEGFRYKNFFATYLLGPLLVLNPPFTRYLLRLMGRADEPAFEKAVTEAYDFRLKNLEKEGVNFIVGEHG